jgi:hypothetical protein
MFSYAYIYMHRYTVYIIIYMLLNVHMYYVCRHICIYRW